MDLALHGERTETRAAEVYVAHLLERHEYAAAVSFVCAAIRAPDRRQVIRGAVRRRPLAPAIADRLETAVDDGRVRGVLQLSWEWTLDRRWWRAIDRQGATYRATWARAAAGALLGVVPEGGLREVVQAAVHDATATRGRHPELKPLTIAEFGDARSAAAAIERELVARLRR